MPMLPVLPSRSRTVRDDGRRLAAHMAGHVVLPFAVVRRTHHLAHCLEGGKGWPHLGDVSGKGQPGQVGWRPISLSVESGFVPAGRMKFGSVGIRAASCCRR